MLVVAAAVLSPGPAAGILGNTLQGVDHYWDVIKMAGSGKRGGAAAS